MGALPNAAGPVAIATPEVYAALVKDVAENGLAAPVVLHEGRVLDGVHRLGARGAGRARAPRPRRGGRLSIERLCGESHVSEATARRTLRPRVRVPASPCRNPASA